MTDTSRPPIVPAPFASPGASDTVHQCDECGAPVDIAQRYCVACGAHRRHVNDPAARYLSEATARARTRKVTAQRAAPAPATGRARGLALALAIALIPVAAAGGVLEGRSSNSQDAQLIQALSHRQAAATTTTVSAAAPSTATGSASATTRSGSTTKRRTARKAPAPSPKNAGKVLSKTNNGTAAQITGFKPSQSQVQQGAAETQKVQKSTGQSYVGGQNNLPSQVVVP